MYRTSPPSSESGGSARLGMVHEGASGSRPGGMATRCAGATRARWGHSAASRHWLDAAHEQLGRPACRYGRASGGCVPAAARPGRWADRAGELPDDQPGQPAISLRSRRSVPSRMASSRYHAWVRRHASHRTMVERGSRARNPRDPSLSWPVGMRRSVIGQRTITRINRSTSGWARSRSGRASPSSPRRKHPYTGVRNLRDERITEVSIRDGAAQGRYGPERTSMPASGWSARPLRPG